MREKTIDLLERILLNHALISSIHFKKPLPALQKLNAEIEQHIRELKNIPSDLSETSAPSETSDLSGKTEKNIVEYKGQRYRKAERVLPGVKDCKFCCFNHGKDCWRPREDEFEGCAYGDFHWEKVKEQSK